MTHRLASQLTLLAFVSFVSTADAQPEITDREVSATSGKIVKIEGQVLTYSASTTDRKLTKRVAENADIVLNRKPVSIDKLQVGDVIRLTVAKADPTTIIELSAARIGGAPAETLPTPMTTDRPRSKELGDPKAGLGVTVTDSPNQGVLVLAVTPDSPAQTSGILAGDFIMAIDSSRIIDPTQMMTLVAKLEPGDSVAVSVWRSSGKSTLNTTVASPSIAIDKAVDSPSEFLKSVTKSERDMLGITLENSIDGVMITSVQDGSAADAAGLMQGDIVTKVDTTAITSPIQLRETITATGPGNRAIFFVTRGDRFVQIPVIVGSSERVEATVSAAEPTIDPRTPVNPDRTDSDYEALKKEQQELRERVLRLEIKLRAIEQ